jgi:multidrug efflux pump
MNSIIEFANQRKRAVLLVFIMILLTGISTYTNIPLEKTPDVQFPAMYVSVKHDGISPDDGESMIVKPLESELRGIEGVKEIKSIAREGFVSVFIEFNAGFDTKKALQDVREAVETAKAELPEESEEPVVTEINLSTFPVLNVILYGDIPDIAMQRIADDLKDKIETVPSVLSVDIGGEKEDVVDIIIDPTVLENYNLTSSIVELSQQNNLLVAAGALDSESGRFTVKVPGLLEDIMDILNLPVMSMGDNAVTVKEIAEVRKTFKDPTGYARVNGKPALVLEVSKRVGENIIDTISQVREIVESESQLWPAGINVIFSQDQSDDIKDMVNELQNNIILAVILVVVVIIAFIGTRAAFLIAISIPGAFLLGILAIGMLDMTLNIVVLFSLIMSVGMLVDSSIVVIEYANRKMAEGEKPQVAFRMAAKRMAWPIISSTVTTLVVFAPLLFWPGVIGQFMKYMPLTLIATLSGSLIMALIFMPVVGSVIGRPDKYDKESINNIKTLEEGRLDQLEGFTKKYVQLLEKVVNHSGKFVLGLAVLFMLTIIIYSQFGRGNEFFPKIEPSAAQIIIRARGNLSTIEKDNLLRQAEAKVLDMKDEVEVFYARSGDISGQGKEFPEDSIGVITLEFTDWQQRRTAQEIIDDIRSRIGIMPGIIIDVLEQKEGPPSAKEINIEVSSRYPEKIIPAVETILAGMKEIGGFIDVTDTRPIPEIEYEISFDRAQASKFNVNMAILGNYVKLVTNGLKLTTYRPETDTEEVDIMLRFPEDKRQLEQLDSLKVISDKGAVPISNFTSREANAKTGKIERVNGMRTIKIEANPESGTLADDLVKASQKWLEEAYRDAKIDPRVIVNFKGQNEDQQETGQFLGSAFILAIFGMVIILTLQFNSIYQMLIIMSAVVLSTIGVLLGLLLTNQPFGVVMCGVGIISLAGIVVNNNIIFIDTYKIQKERGMGTREALLRTGAQRLRPILLTAGTTVLGLLPMVFQMNIDFINRITTFGAPSTQWWQQLSTTIAGGLTFSTILTLFLTPSLIILGERLFKAYDDKYGKLRPFSKRTEAAG